MLTSAFSPWRLSERDVRLQEGLLLSATDSKRRRTAYFFLQGMRRQVLVMLRQLTMRSASSAESNGGSTDRPLFIYTSTSMPQWRPRCHEPRKHQSRRQNDGHSVFNRKHLKGFPYKQIDPERRANNELPYWPDIPLRSKHLSLTLGAASFPEEDSDAIEPRNRLQ